jgi:hypothetical protein
VNTAGCPAVPSLTTVGDDGMATPWLVTAPAAPVQGVAANAVVYIMTATIPATIAKATLRVRLMM